MIYLLYFFIAIIYSYIRVLPISYNTNLILFQKIFNTNIFFDNNLEFITNIIFISMILLNQLKKISLKPNKNKIKYLIILLISTIPSILINFFIKTKITLFRIILNILITSLLIILSIKKQNNKNISLKIIIILILLEIVLPIPEIANFTFTLLFLLVCNINKKEALQFSYLSTALSLLIITLLNIPNINITTLLNPKYLVFTIVLILYTTKYINKLKNLINLNKLYKLVIYNLIIIVFTIFLLYL